MSSEPDLQKAETRIQWEDVENAPRRGRPRSNSRDSMSIRSISRRRIVEPNVALPIQFRTLYVKCS
jgi:sodium/potassium-transporting ATPase subunit alpha